MPRWRQRDEELAAVGVGARVGHAEHASGGVRELGHDFVGESAVVGAVDGGAAAACARGITCLDHEIADDAVAGDGVVEAGGGEGGEVVAGLGLLDGLGLGGESWGFFIDLGFILFYLWGLFAEKADGDVAHGRMNQYSFGDVSVVSGHGALVVGDIGLAVWKWCEGRCFGTATTEESF